MGREVFDFNEFEDVIRKINHWYRSTAKILSITTVPFNTTLIFNNIISEVIGENKKVLYVWGKDGEDRRLIQEIREVRTRITYTQIESGLGQCDINFVNYKNIDKIIGNYGLIILDDISTFSTLNKIELKLKYEEIAKCGERVIVYSMEEITSLGEKFEAIPENNNYPFVEPRIITTRIDLNKDIPYILYDYLKWFRDDKKRVIIYTPNKEKLQLVYAYYSNKLKMDGVKVVTVSKKDDKKTIRNVLMIKDKATFIITDFMEVSLEDSKVSDAVVLFADSREYNYKKLLYLCGQIGRINKKHPEVLFVSRDVSEEMDRAKDMSRVFNKKLWEKRSKRY